MAFLGGELLLGRFAGITGAGTRETDCPMGLEATSAGLVASVEITEACARAALRRPRAASSRGVS